MTTCNIINPSAIPSIKSDKPATNTYSIEINSSKQSFTSAGVASESTGVDKVTNFHTALMSAMTDLIRVNVGQDYIPPTGLYDFNVSVTDSSGFITFVKNAVLTGNDGTTGIDLLTLPSLIDAKVEYIAERMFGLFVRSQTHILTSETNTDVCAGDNSRLFYMKIENCLFTLCATYN